MNVNTYEAMLITESVDGSFTRTITERRLDELPAGDVLIRVHYSSLNYKDVLSATGNRGVTKMYPHTPGIDAAGVVEESTTEVFRPGDAVIVTGHDLGMNTPGGFGEYIRVPAEWVVLLPNGLSLRQSMILGTPGLTAALSIRALDDACVQRNQGKVLVTGATGGVGSLAVLLLSEVGYSVAAVTGKEDKHDFLRNLGAKEILHRDAILATSNHMLLKSTWSAVVDTLGGKYLDSALRATAYGGVVTTCGMVASPRLDTNVFPFILRSVRLQGIDSAECPMAIRRDIWNWLAETCIPEKLEELAIECNLENLDEHIERMLQGGMTGRVVVRISETK